MKNIDVTEKKSIPDVNTKMMEHVQILNIVQTKDKIIVVQTLKFTKQLPNEILPQYHSNFVVLSFYDRGCKLLKKIGLNQAFYIYAPTALNPGFHVKDDKLLITTCAIGGSNSYANMFSSVNTTTMQVEQFTAMDKGRLKKQVPTEAAATLWFGDSFVLNHLIPKGAIIEKDVNTVLQVVTL